MTSISTISARDAARLTAARELRKMSQFVGRQGLTGWTDRDAAGHFRSALRAVLVVEDTFGVEAAAGMADRLTLIRQRAQAAGLISVEQVCNIERELTS